MADPAAFVGIDLGTSGARVIALSADGRPVAEGRSALVEHGQDPRDPAAWWSAVCAAIEQAQPALADYTVRALSVDATSGTLLATAEDGTPLAPGSMYNESCADEELLERIRQLAPPDSPVQGATSALARALELHQHLQPVCIVHQADWIAGRLCGVFASDDNNALKTGYDSIAAEWPAWLAQCELPIERLPEVHAPGTVYARLNDSLASSWRWPADVAVVAGTTDGCASFLATGAAQPGDGVTALGSTLTIKLLSRQPVFDAGSGVYSHRLLGMWLAGGASNTGGQVLLAHFDAAEIRELSARLDVECDTGLDYYPLNRAGERFPIADPALAPRLTPVPADRSRFLQGMLEGIADIEALAYRQLAARGAPALRTVRSVGGGAANPAWTRLRERRLKVPMAGASSTEAAFGAALLARHACR